MKQVGATLQMTGALLLSLNITESWLAYWWMLTGALILLHEYRADRVQVQIWFLFATINLIGIARWTPWL